MSKKYIKILISYYGAIQILHILMNALILFYNRDWLLLASPLLTESDARVLLVSLFIDLVIASPLGVIGAILYFQKRQKLIAKKILIISLSAALLSALVYIGTLIWFESFVLNMTTLVFGVLFIPILFLFQAIITRAD